MGKSLKDAVQETALEIVDTASEVLEKIHTPATRAGYAVERTAKLAKMGYSDRTIASILTDNSPTNQTYESTEIPTLKKLAADTEAGGVGVTKKQFNQLKRDKKPTQTQAKNPKFA